MRPDLDAIIRAAATSFVRACTAAAAGAADRSLRPADFVARTWPHDRDAALMVKSATSPTTTANAGTLVQTTIFAGFLASLSPVSAGAALIARGISLEFGEGVGAILVPGIVIPVAPFVGEGMPIPVVSGAVSGPILMPSKLAAITTLTRETLQGSPQNVEALVTVALRESVALSLDAAMFSANAATPVAPAGLLYGVAPLAASAATPPVDAMVEDLSALASSIARAAAGPLVFVAAPEQAISIALRAPRELPYAVLATAALAAGTVIAINAAALAAALDSSPRIDANKETLLHMETEPAPIVGAPGVVAAPARSLFQTDAIALRIICQAAWAMRAPGAIAWTQDANW